jgi:hypothetical protein
MTGLVIWLCSGRRCSLYLVAVCHKPCARPVRAATTNSLSLAASAGMTSRTHHTILLVLVWVVRQVFAVQPAAGVAAQQNPVCHRYGTQQMADSSRQSPNAYDMNNRFVSMTFQMCWVGETYVADWLHMAVLACCTNPVQNSATVPYIA